MKMFLTFLMSVTIAFSAYAATPASEKPAAKEKWQLVKLDASVEKINKKERELTLKDSDGSMVTMTAGDEIKRFDEISVGDKIEAKYWTFLRAEFREPTAEEKAGPLQIIAEAGIAPKEMTPAGAVGAVVKAVVTVVSINKAERIVAIQGPMGDFLILPVEDDAVLNNLKVGEVVIMTYAEAVALSLNKIK